MKKRFSLQRKQVIVCIAAFIAALAAAFFCESKNSPFILVFILLISFILILVFGSNDRKRSDKAVKALAKFSDNQDKYTNPQAIPTVVADADGIILESNAAFYALMDSACTGMNIKVLIPGIESASQKHVVLNEKTYAKEYSEIVSEGYAFSIYRFIDEDKVTETQSLYKTKLGVVAIIQIDNFDDLLRSIPKKEHSEVMVRIENIIAGTADNVDGFYQQFSNDKYIMVFERRRLASFMENKFDILRRVKLIETSVNIKPTLSVGVGARSTFKASMENAAAALDLALSRGGDQAVIKERQGYKFYGGGQQAPEMRIRVRARMFATKLRDLMEQCGNIVVTGHAVPDLDCMGAALGVCACAKYLNKKANIVLDRPNAAIDELVREMQADTYYRGLLVTPAEAEKLMTPNTMLVIVDTQISAYTLASELIDRAKTIVIIDHHLRGTSHIENAALLYHEPYASSSCELVCELVQYFSDHLHLKPLEAAALLSGITIDTKGFSFKSGVRTFEAAAYLKKNGADMASIRHLFQDDLETFTNRSNVVQGASISETGIAIAVCPKDSPNPQLLAAQSADSLLSIRGVRASFVLSVCGKEIVISGRSLGQINVQRILEKLGGGGHSTMAGAQLRKSSEEAVELLNNAISEYLKEE